MSTFVVTTLSKGKTIKNVIDDGIDCKTHSYNVFNNPKEVLNHLALAAANPNVIVIELDDQEINKNKKLSISNDQIMSLFSYDHLKVNLHIQNKNSKLLTVPDLVIHFLNSNEKKVKKVFKDEMEIAQLFLNHRKDENFISLLKSSEFQQARNLLLKITENQEVALLILNSRYVNSSQARSGKGIFNNEEMEIIKQRAEQKPELSDEESDEEVLSSEEELEVKGKQEEKRVRFAGTFFPERGEKKHKKKIYTEISEVNNVDDAIALIKNLSQMNYKNFSENSSKYATPVQEALSKYEKNNKFKDSLFNSSKKEDICGLIGELMISSDTFTAYILNTNSYYSVMPSTTMLEAFLKHLFKPKKDKDNEYHSEINKDFIQIATKNVLDKSVFVKLIYFINKDQACIKKILNSDNFLAYLTRATGEEGENAKTFLDMVKEKTNDVNTKSKIEKLRKKIGTVKSDILLDTIEFGLEKPKFR